MTENKKQALGILIVSAVGLTIGAATMNILLVCGCGILLGASLATVLA